MGNVLYQYCVVQNAFLGVEDMCQDAKSKHTGARHLAELGTSCLGDRVSIKNNNKMKNKTQCHLAAFFFLAYDASVNAVSVC